MDIGKMGASPKPRVKARFRRPAWHFELLSDMFCHRTRLSGSSWPGSRFPGVLVGVWPISWTNSCAGDAQSQIERPILKGQASCEPTLQNRLVAQQKRRWREAGAAERLEKRSG